MAGHTACRCPECARLDLRFPGEGLQLSLGLAHRLQPAGAARLNELRTRSASRKDARP